MELIEVQTRAIGPLVRDIAFTLARGEVLALIGPNGAGKSTLIRAILGLAPAQGRILLQGAALQTLPRAEIARRVAWVPQSLSPPPLALRDFVVLGRLSRHPPFAAPSAADWQAVDAALTRLRLTPLAEAPLPRLSGGERQLALIARALVQDAPLLLMDEPDASLDWGNRRRLARLIHDLAQEGRGLILATHDPETARRCTGLLCLDQGRAEVLPPDALTEARLEQLYGA